MPRPDAPASAHASFLLLVPRIRLHGRVYFRHLRCRHRRQEAIAEMVALCWQWYVRLLARGKDPHQFPSALATFAARAVRGGRRLCGIDRARDVLSPRAQRDKGFAVTALPEVSSLSGSSPLEEALHENTISPVPEQVCFRLDFPCWRASRTDRDRHVIDDLLLGERTQDVAARFGLSEARVSQLRREFHDDWHRFCADPAEG